jgi:hypothetical protein
VQYGADRKRYYQYANTAGSVARRRRLTSLDAADCALCRSLVSTALMYFQCCRLNEKYMRAHSSNENYRVSVVGESVDLRSYITGEKTNVARNDSTRKRLDNNRPFCGHFYASFARHLTARHSRNRASTASLRLRGNGRARTHTHVERNVRTHAHARPLKAWGVHRECQTG